MKTFNQQEATIFNYRHEKKKRKMDGGQEAINQAYSMIYVQITPTHSYKMN